MQLSSDINPWDAAVGVPPHGSPLTYLVDSALDFLVDDAGDYLVDMT